VILGARQDRIRSVLRHHVSALSSRRTEEQEVFEIGSSLRDARERRGVELSDVERATRIRSRYLKALEDERFDLIPGLVYAKGFLRTYADFLGLDADRFVDELASRRRPEEEEAAPAPLPVGRRRRLSTAPLLGFVVVAGAGVAIWVLGSTSGGSKPGSAPPPPPPAGVAGRTKTLPSSRPPARERVAALVLRASAGRCWIEANADSRSGRSLYYSTLEQGRSLRLTQKRIWLRLGAPSALSATLNGKPVALPRSQNPVDLLVTPRGVQRA
jgi:cytoskeleton protein RodZ